MEKKFITRKIQLIIDSTDKDYIGEVYATLYHWRAICQKAANLLMTHHFVLEQIKDIMYFTEDVKVKLADVKGDELGILSTSKMNSGYRMMSQHFKGGIPTHILSSLNKRITAFFNENKMDYLFGKKTLPNYKADMAIPFKGTDIKHLKQSENGYDYKFSLFKIPFKTYLGRDVFYKRELMEEWANGSRQIKTSMLQLEGNKIYLLATFELENIALPLDPSIVAELYLGAEYPVLLHIGNKNFTIGTNDGFLHRRLAIQAAINRKFAAFGKCTSNKEKAKRSKAVQPLKEKDKAFVNTKQHQYSRTVVDICTKNGVGTILLCKNQDEVEDEKSILKHWSYYGLKEKIKYKSSMSGITLVEE